MPLGRHLSPPITTIDLAAGLNRWRHQRAQHCRAEFFQLTAYEGARERLLVLLLAAIVVVVVVGSSRAEPRRKLATHLPVAKDQAATFGASVAHSLDYHESGNETWAIGIVVALANIRGGGCGCVRWSSPGLGWIHHVDGIFAQVGDPLAFAKLPFERKQSASPLKAPGTFRLADDHAVSVVHHSYEPGV